MTAAKDRKVAAGVLGITLQAEYRGMRAADSQETINAAAMKLGNTFNQNIEFIIWVLKDVGGISQMPIDRRPAAPKHDPLPPTPAIFGAGRDVDMPKRKL